LDMKLRLEMGQELERSSGERDGSFSNGCIMGVLEGRWKDAFR
jgi:hypothetical protein